jgi:excinuclease ABC subunit A
VIDLGPRAGTEGGRVLAEGSPEEVLAHPDSLTAEYLGALEDRERGRTLDPVRPYAPWDDDHPRLEIRGARANNLRDITVEMPTRCLVAVTGLSGSGKSTLVENVLYGTHQRAQGVVDVEPGECDGLAGLEEVRELVMVDQRPLGRSSRSNPVTYVKAWDEIRKLFAAEPAAKKAGITAGHFSFNLDLGRCPECKGIGTQEVDMHFMASVQVVCEACQGHRFRPAVLAITCRGRNIHETLELTVREATEVFADRRPLFRKLEPLLEVGLGYLRLGQSTATLSGGEAQRLKLASYLGRSRKHQDRLFLFDEPSTGLHLADIHTLLRAMGGLLERGNGVIVVEHSLELIAAANWIVDLGPGGGEHGGELLFSGPIEDFLDQGESPTADELRRYLKWRRKKGKAR